VKVRLLPPALLLALLVGLLSPAPALAVIRATSIRFLHEDFHLFSPFRGPAKIRLTWSGSDPNVNLTFRLRRGDTVVHEETYPLLTPSSPTEDVVDFTWPAQTVSEPTEYTVVVLRGGTVLRSRNFELKPRLVTITSIRPNPFFPLVRDGYKDITTVRFHLEASSNPTIVQIFRANRRGECCGRRIRRQNLEDQAIGDRTYEWNGRRGDGTKVRKGKFFVRITATKESFPEDVTRLSNPKAVRVRPG
jgi:FlgD Ig-like domain